MSAGSIHNQKSLSQWPNWKCSSEWENLDMTCNLSNDDRKPVLVCIMAETAVTTEHDLATVISVFVTMSHSVLGVHFLWDLAGAFWLFRMYITSDMCSYKRISWPSPCRLNRNFWWYLFDHATMLPVDCQYRYLLFENILATQRWQYYVIMRPGPVSGGTEGRYKLKSTKLHCERTPAWSPLLAEDWLKRTLYSDSVTIMLWEYQG